MNVLHYLKFCLFHVVGLLAAAALYAGGDTTALSLLGVVLFYVIGDLLGGDDLSTPTLHHPAILTGQLWLALPLLMLIVGAAMDSFIAGRYATPLQLGAAVLLTGLMIGMIGTITAHELVHRTKEPASLLIGRWLLAFSFDTGFAIEHVYGHHRYVSTGEDPATAPRGRSVYWHIVCSTVRGNISAWQLERKRLERRGHRQYSRHNMVISGHLMSVLLLAAAWYWGGAAATLFFAVCRLVGQGAAGSGQLHGALWAGAQSGQAGAAAPFVEHQQAPEFLDHVQPDAPLAPPRPRRRALPRPASLPGRAADDRRLSVDHPGGAGAAAVASPDGAAPDGLGPAPRQRRGTPAGRPVRRGLTALPLRGNLA